MDPDISELLQVNSQSIPPSIVEEIVPSRVEPVNLSASTTRATPDSVDYERPVFTSPSDTTGTNSTLMSSLQTNLFANDDDTTTNANTEYSGPSGEVSRTCTSAMIDSSGCSTNINDDILTSFDPIYQITVDAEMSDSSRIGPAHSSTSASRSHTDSGTRLVVDTFECATSDVLSSSSGA
eukprot:988360_1